MSRTSRIKMLTTVASLARETSRPGAPGLTERAHSVPRLVRATLDGSYLGTSRSRLVLLAVAVAYVLSPVDLVPELLLPIIGAVDDAVVISWAFKVLIDETDRFIAWELGQGIHPSAPGAADPTAWSAPLPLPWSGSLSGSAFRSARVPGQRRLRSDEAHQLAGPVRSAATTYVLESMRKRLER